MAVWVLSTVSLTFTGVVAGVFFAVAVSVVPALAAMSPNHYVRTHQLLGKGYHPWMPLIVTVALVADIANALLAGGSARWLFAIAAALLVGVQLVSQFANVPINRVVNRMVPANLPPDWSDPRPSWRAWHQVRTVSALLAMILTSLAAAPTG